MTVRCDKCGSVLAEAPPVRFMTFDGHEPEALEVKPQLRLVTDVAIALDGEALK